MRAFMEFILILAFSPLCFHSFHHVIRRYIYSESIKKFDCTTSRRGDRLNDSPKTSIASSTIEKMLVAARQLRSEVISIEGSNNSSNQLPKSDFSEFITTSAIDLAAAKVAELNKASFSIITAAAAANDSVPTTADSEDQKNNSTSLTADLLLEAREVKPDIWETTRRFIEIEESNLENEENEVEEDDDDDDDDAEDSPQIIIRMAPVQENGKEFWYSKDNFTFAALPQYVQDDWKKISAVETFEEIESALRQTIGNPMFNFIFDWFFKEIMKAYNSNSAASTALDKTFLQVAVKSEILNVLTRLENEVPDTYWDFFSLQGNPSDGIMLFYALFKCSYDSTGRKLAPSSSEMSIPVLNFDDLTAFLGYGVPEKKSVKEIDLKTPVIAVSSADKMLPAASAVNTTDLQTIEIFEILKSVISNNTTDSELFSNLSKLLDVASSEMGSTAEVLISEYFDEDSRQTGMTVSKAGAALFQRDVLRDCLVVSNVKMSQGAVVFEGSISAGCKKEELAKKIEEKFVQSGLDNTFKYIIINNEKILSVENGISELVMDSLQGALPSVILFPASWNATLLATKNNPLRNAFRQIIGSLSVTSTVTMAATCFGLFTENSPFIETGALPEDFWPMILAAMSIQYAGLMVESVVAKLKGVDVSTVLLPSYNILFNYGPRSLYLNMPKNRNDLFDMSFAGTLTTLGLSMAAIFTGLKYTADATQAAINTFPTVPIAMLKLNSIMAQLLSNTFPALAGAISTSVMVNPGLESINSGVLGGGGVDATLVHLHWLVIVGVMTFISSVLQLIPLDNSAGSKMTGAALGKDLQTVVSSSFFVLKITLFVLVIFNVGGVSTAAVINKPKLLFDYFLLSQIMGSERDSQLAVDSLCEISDGRKNIFYAFVFLLTMSFFPYLEYATSINLIVDGSIGYIRDLFYSGSSAISSSF